MSKKSLIPQLKIRSPLPKRTKIVNTTNNNKILEDSKVKETEKRSRPIPLSTHAVPFATHSIPFGTRESKQVVMNRRLPVVSPGIKITVSPDTPDIESLSSAQQLTLRAIMESCRKKGMEEKANLEDFVNGDFTNVIDFGITDFLSSKEEVEVDTVDVSSDTDASYLEATPPQRFSDSELELEQIEAMSITLHTSLDFQQVHTSEPEMESDSDTPQAHPSSDSDSDLSQRRTPKAESRSPLKTESSPGRIEKERSSESLHSCTDKDFILKGNNIELQRQMMVNTRNAQKPFRRHISLPASLFMSYLLNQDKTQKSSSEFQNDTVLSSNLHKRMLSKIDSFCSSSSSENLYDELHFSTATTSGSERFNGSNGNSSTDSISVMSDWVSKSNSLESEEVEDFENQAFTSDVEKRSLILRHMRKLIRQDTTGNIAPPDFCI